MNQPSCLYEGSVRHRRFQPKSNVFAYPIYLFYIDLEDLYQSDDPAIKACRARFRRSDHFGDPDQDLTTAIREMVQDQAGIVLTGPIRMLAHLREGGYVMNPATFFYCFEPKGEEAIALVVEVHNTPWNERHCYVLSGKSLRESAMFTFQKVFHVSPFMPMDHTYQWTFSHPGERLSVHMENHSADVKVFDATLQLRRRELTQENIKILRHKHKFMTYKVIYWIYANALKLWRKGVPSFTHPKKLKAGEK